jgi:nucleotide-binding universal stress UspA family protein
MKVLICSDGSAQAERALRLGASLAAGCQAEATLLGIVEERGDSKDILEALKRGFALLEEKKLKAELITKSGKAIEEIVQQTKLAAYDLVVIGAVHKENRGLFWISSKSYKITKQIRPPVLIVPGEATTPKRMLLCSGGKRYIEKAVRLAGELARGVGASITLLHVTPEPPAIYAGLPRVEEDTERVLRSESELGVNLRREREILQTVGVAVDVKLRHGPVVGEILAELREGNYDLVVAGSALSNSFRTYALGDVTREILNRTRCPVLVVRSEREPLGTARGRKGWLGRLTPG